MREPAGTLPPGERFVPRGSPRAALWLLGLPVGLAVAFAGLGVLYASSGEQGLFGRDFDLGVFGKLGGSVGLLLGLIVSVALFLARRAESKKR